MPLSGPGGTLHDVGTPAGDEREPDREPERDAPSATSAPAGPKQAAEGKTAVEPLSRGRRIAVWTCIVLATVLALVSILTTWVKRQMLDNSAWNRATTQIIQDPKVQTALATYTVNQLYQHVNVSKALQRRLPPTLDPLAPTLAGALQQPATQGVKLALERPRVQQLFIRVSEVAHQKLIRVLENRTGYGIHTGGGVVTLNLHELVVDVGTELGISSDTLAKLPGTAGTITLMRSDQLSAAQTGVQAVRVASVWLLVAVLFLYGLAIYLARGVRRATIRNAGIAFALVGLVVLIIRTLLGNYVVNSLASPGYQPATHRLWLIGTAVLGQIGAAAVLYGVVAALGAVFAGPTHVATALRRRLAPVLNEQQGFVWAAVGFVYLLAIRWGGTHALRTWWGILLLAGLIALGIVALRRQTLQEFPPGTHVEPAAAAAAATPGREAEATTAGAGGGRSAAHELSRLAELHASGALSDDEFERAKRIALT
jgi:Short C-terminal domain